jgi:hypothetical protein
MALVAKVGIGMGKACVSVHGLESGPEHGYDINGKTIRLATCIDKRDSVCRLGSEYLGPSVWMPKSVGVATMAVGLAGTCW